MAARGARALVPASAAAVTAATLLVLPGSSLTATTHAGASPAGALAGAVAGTGLLTSAAVVWALQPARGVATLMGLAGIAWFAPDWVGWLGGPPLARSLAMVVEPSFLVLMFHVVIMAAPGGLGAAPRRAVWPLYGMAATVSVGRALLRDPFLDPSCWSNCQVNVFLVSAQPRVARALDDVWLAVSLLVGLLLVVATVRRLATGARSEWARVGPLLVPSALLGLTFAVYAVAVWGQGPERPSDLVFATLFQSRAWASVAVALGVVWLTARARRLRGVLARLATDAGAVAASDSLGRSLARAAGDPRLEVAYPLDDGERHVDAAGREVDLTSVAFRRAVTPIVRDDATIALVISERSAVASEALRGEIGAAASLALDNERLRAEALARLRHLRASRERVVAAEDAERRRLERNLHDGAQQRLLALTYDLRVARSTARAAGDTARAALLASAERTAQEAVDDLRDLARGIYPAVLSEAGLGPALMTLIDDAPFPVDLDELPDDRFPAVVERTAFVVVAEAIDAASAADVRGLRVRVLRSDGCLVVQIEGLGMLSEQVADRVGAIGGRLETEERAVRAELPCG